MRAIILQNAIKLAQKRNGPISKIAVGAASAHSISVYKLRTLLEEAGYVVTYHEGPGEDAPEGKHPIGAWVLVKLDGEVKARAYSHDEEDALLQAVNGAMREEDGAAVVAKELDTRGFKVTPELRQALESRYITAGMDALTKELNAFGK